MQALVKALRPIETACSGISEWTGKLVAWLLVAMVAVQFAVVVIRYGFDTGSIAMQQSVSFMHAALFLLAAAFTLKHDAHVRVDIFYRDWSAKGKALANLIGTLFLLFPSTIFIAVYSWEYVSFSWGFYEGSNEAGGLDGVFLVKSCIPVMAILVSIQGLAMVSQALITLLTGETAQEETKANYG
jgi:TRAP-type mannitol/chloroaromatic compound transport system permease small subunit